MQSRWKGPITPVGVRVNRGFSGPRETDQRTTEDRTVGGTEDRRDRPVVGLSQVEPPRLHLPPPPKVPRDSLLSSKTLTVGVVLPPVGGCPTTTVPDEGPGNGKGETGIPQPPRRTMVRRIREDPESRSKDSP